MITVSYDIYSFQKVSLILIQRISTLFGQLEDKFTVLRHGYKVLGKFVAVENKDGQIA